VPARERGPDQLGHPDFQGLKSFTAEAAAAAAVVLP